VAEALERRRAGAGDPAERPPGRGAGGPLAERLVDALERQLARAVARRLGGGASDRTPGALEQRLVAALERRLSRGRHPGDADQARGLGRVGRNLAGRRPGGRLAARRPTTLRALVVGLLARGVVRALAVLGRTFGRAVISRPMRWFARLLGRSAVHARPSRKAGILAFLLAAVALLARAVSRRVAAMSEARRAAILLALRLFRTLLPALGRRAARLAALVVRELRRAVAARGA
jgi:hypothetical protein